ncbi:DUF421 domain-containing protein [Pedobacter sp.]|uniref:DUF421 domain-containing protein n=1 Tax=Pedobacter sp. TaxID=1411316 RepID=UPI003D7F205E
MKKEDIKWDDWHRILIGSAPTDFLTEVLFRTIIMYIVLLVILRLLGKRMGGMHTNSELAIMVTLGAIICVPMQIPDRGIIQGIFVLLFALAFQRGLNLIGWKSEGMERLIQGKESMVLKDGVILVEELEKTKITRQQLYAVLRSQGIRTLGEVERVYIEACGLFSVFKYEEPKPGLSILPPKDPNINQVQPAPDQEALVCANCGKIISSSDEEEINCENCHHHIFQHAIL